MDQDKCSYVRFVLMLDAVGTRESAHPAGNGCNGNLFACEADIGLLDIVRHAIEETAMDFMQLLEHLHAPAGPAAIGIDVIPVIGGEFGRMVEAVRIERSVERANRFKHGSFRI